MGQVVIVAGLGVVLFLVGFFQMKKSRASGSWPSTVGTVQKAEIYSDWDGDPESTSALAIRVEYQFQASGREWTGTRIRFDQIRYASTRQAQKALGNYPVGGPVQVYFDPQNPSECVLEKKNSAGWVFLIVGAIFVVVAIAGAFK
jgi:hypothetical protein